LRAAGARLSAQPGQEDVPESQDLFLSLVSSVPWSDLQIAAQTSLHTRDPLELMQFSQLCRT
jgi:hypothetical protein